ncbi:uncharacterized protein LOC128958390 [Oppia nitens]|uniref:uncharacterized protein LOC128958390 n=1 Tax=Oppia nitens TaxID=1686743 RepID=UPI0023DAA033|nr:uncharacterized protein LOC128958390 [Oppia nitens]
MKSNIPVIVCYLIVMTYNIYNCEKVQRLVLPSLASSLRIIPSVQMPIVTSNSIQSGFSFRLPIAIQFPSALDFAQSFRQTLYNGNTIDFMSSSLDSNRTRVTSRANLYRAIEKTHSRLGRVCLLRAICEVAEVPFMSASHGLIGQLIDMLLSSSLLTDSTGVLKRYKEAEIIGKSGSKKQRCKAHYKECPFSLFNFLDVPIGG